MNKKNIIIGIFVGLIIVLLIFFTLNRFGFLSGKYFFPNKFQSNNIIDILKDEDEKTSITYNHTYNNIEINTNEEANKLIINDSVEQKNNCPNNIIKIENEIINKYKIKAVNLCEINYNEALEIENILNFFDSNFPNTLKYLTNISIVNTNESYITKFIPFWIFTKSSNDLIGPWTIKTEILLNSKYFLNEDLFNETFDNIKKLSFYPRNANKISIISSEIGNFLAYLTIIKKNNMELDILLNRGNLNNYHTVLSTYENDKFFLNFVAETYEEYKKETNTTMSLYDFRKSISNYSVIKNNQGNYTYLKTISEAFHDYYLNKSSASDASKYIIKNIKKYLEG